MAIFDKESSFRILNEKSHGSLKSSFRTVQNPENGHIIKVVYDLNSKDIDQVGDHTRQENRDSDKDAKTIKNINKTGSTDFSSRGTIKAIVDMDTGKRLNSVKGIGVVGSDGTRLKVPKEFSDKNKNSEESSNINNYSRSDREKIAAHDINKDSKKSKDAITYTVGEKESKPSYKSTIATKSTTNLYNNQFGKSSRGFDKKRFEESRNINKAVEKLEKEYDTIKDRVKDSDDEDAEYTAKYFEKQINKMKQKASDNKDEKYGQTAGDSRYYKMYKNADDSLDQLKQMVKDNKKEIKKESSAVYGLKFIQEKYISKYAKYLDDDENDKSDIDDEEDEDEEKKSSTNQKNEKNSSNKEDDSKKLDADDLHLTRDEIRKCLDAIKVILSNYPELKKCCDFIDLSDKDKVNDDGQHVSSYDNYYDESPNGFIQLIDGDVWAGYPNFRDGGNEDFEDDCNSFVKKVNELMEKHKIPAKFKVGSDKQSEESISFGVKSLKGK